MKKSQSIKMKQSNLQGFTRYLSQHQIGKSWSNKQTVSTLLLIVESTLEIPLRVILFIVAGYFLKLPFFQNFIFITNQRNDGRYEKSFWDLAFLFFYICVFTALRAAIMNHILTPAAKYFAVPIKKYQRFAEQSWAFIYYTFAFLFGIVSIPALFGLKE